MRTFLSHDDTAKWFAAGDQATSEMLSLGPLTSWVSLDSSPAGLFAEEEEDARPKIVDILSGEL